MPVLWLLFVLDSLLGILGVADRALLGRCRMVSFVGTRFASRNKCHASSNRCLTSSNKKLLSTCQKANGQCSVDPRVSARHGPAAVFGAPFGRSSLGGASRGGPGHPLDFDVLPGFSDR